MARPLGNRLEDEAEGGDDDEQDDEVPDDGVDDVVALLDPEVQLTLERVAEVQGSEAVPAFEHVHTLEAQGGVYRVARRESAVVALDLKHALEVGLAVRAERGFLPMERRRRQERGGMR